MANHLLNVIQQHDGPKFTMISMYPIKMYYSVNIFLVNILQVYTPSDQVLKKIVRKNWKIRGGTIDKDISLLVTPKVQVN